MILVPANAALVQDVGLDHVSRGAIRSAEGAVALAPALTRDTVSPSVNSRLAGKMSLGALRSWRNSAGNSWASNRRDSEPPLHFPGRAPGRLARTFTPGDTVSR